MMWHSHVIFYFSERRRECGCGNAKDESETLEGGERRGKAGRGGKKRENAGKDGKRPKRREKTGKGGKRRKKAGKGGKRGKAGTH
jgi:hypothetical protein